MNFRLESCIILILVTLLLPLDSYLVAKRNVNEICEEDKLPPCEGEEAEEDHSEVPHETTTKPPEKNPKTTGVGEKGTLDKGEYPVSFLDAFKPAKGANDDESMSEYDYQEEDVNRKDTAIKRHFQVYEDYLQLYKELFSPPPPPPPVPQTYDSPQLFLTARRARRSVMNNYRTNNRGSHRGKSEIKKLLTDMLHRLDTLESEGTLDDEPETRDHRFQNNHHDYGSDQIHQRKPQSFQQPQPPRPQKIPNTNKCSLHGLWLSAVTGVAFQIEPNYSTGYGLKVQILDSGHQATIKTPHGEETKVITSDWLGSAQVSPERSTTISIVLQEKLKGQGVEPGGGIIEPKTAVFVGQCLICSGTPTIQGSWIIFPEAQTCFKENDRPAKADNLYLLRAVN